MFRSDLASLFRNDLASLFGSDPLGLVGGAEVDGGRSRQTSAVAAHHHGLGHGRQVSGRRGCSRLPLRGLVMVVVVPLRRRLGSRRGVRGERRIIHTVLRAANRAQ